MSHDFLPPRTQYPPSTERILSATDLDHEPLPLSDPIWDETLLSALNQVLDAWSRGEVYGDTAARVHDAVRSAQAEWPERRRLLEAL